MWKLKVPQICKSYQKPGHISFFFLKVMFFKVPLKVGVSLSYFCKKICQQNRPIWSHCWQGLSFFNKLSFSNALMSFDECRDQIFLWTQFIKFSINFFTKNWSDGWLANRGRTFDLDHQPLNFLQKKIRILSRWISHTTRDQKLVSASKVLIWRLGRRRDHYLPQHAACITNIRYGK